MALLPFSALADGRVRVACVGNSITFGHGIANRAENAYPAQLGRYLGAGYEVENFGVSGTTALSKGDYPYVKTERYAASAAFRPDVVLLKLGTNDSKPQNIRHIGDFKDDYRKLVRFYRGLPSKPRVIAVLPVRCFLPKGADIDEARIRTQIVPAIREVALEEGVETVDLSRVLDEDAAAHLMPDRLHPSSIGAGRMARCLSEVLLMPRENGNATAAALAKLSEKHTLVPADFYGHKGVSFMMDDSVACRVVLPLRMAKGRPWVLRARFWGHEPQTDIALLERGFAVAYCDVADLYGAPRAVARWDRFYRLMTRAGFNKKVVLEGMSRGGLIVYNWAAANARRVACVYADAPVLDVRSWPMGRGKGEGSPADARRLADVYGVSPADFEAVSAQAGPLSRVRDLRGIPVLHVVGDADNVVPVAENTAPFVAELNRLGGSAKVIHKPGVGHHPHSLFNPEPIVRFVLRHTGFYRNPCVVPVPGNEYRQGAGWAAGLEWHGVNADIVAALKKGRTDWLFLGNSITQGLGGKRAGVVHRPGEAAANRCFGKGCWETAGISGDRTQNLLWRIERGDYDFCAPAHVVVGIGVNNFFDGDEPVEVAQGIRAVAEAAKRHFPKAEIHVIGLIPAGRDAADPLRTYYNKVRACLNGMKWKGFDYIDVTAWFVAADGSLKPGVGAGDGIHLAAGGYDVWCDSLKAHVDGKR